MLTKNIFNKIIFKKFKAKKLLSSSAFSNVYEGINIKNQIPVILKIEKKGVLELLEKETYFLLNLKGFGIPEVISFGIYGPFKVLVEELLGPNIEDLWEKNAFKKDPFGRKHKFIKDVCMFAIQGLDRLEYVHSKNILHRDIKSKNFIIGRKDPNAIYLIDFGFSKKYKSSRTGKHIRFTYTNTLYGSLFFSSRYAIRGYEQSRRDDLESFGYLIIYLAKGGYLPWYDIHYSNIDKQKKIKELTKIKMQITNERLCSGLPVEFVNFMKYLKTLEFEQTPDYKYLKGLFITILSRMEKGRNILFFWIKPKSRNLLIKLKKNNTNEHSLMLTRRSSYNKKSSGSLKRLYNHIKTSLNQKSKNNREYNISNIKIFPLNKTPKLNKGIYENSPGYEKIIRVPPFANKNLDFTDEIKISENRNNKRESESFINSPQRDNTISNEKSPQKNLLSEKIFGNKNNRRFIIDNSFTNNNIINQTLDSIKGITLYNNMNYNNLYFINNNPINYQSLNRRNFLSPNLSSNHISNNNISSRGNMAYTPIFHEKNRIKNFTKKLNYKSKYFNNNIKINI